MYMMLLVSIVNVTDVRQFNQYCRNFGPNAWNPKRNNSFILAKFNNAIDTLVCIGLPIAVHSLNDISWRPPTPKCQKGKMGVDEVTWPCKLFCVKC